MRLCSLSSLLVLLVLVTLLAAAEETPGKKQPERKFVVWQRQKEPKVQEKVQEGAVIDPGCKEGYHKVHGRCRQIF